MPELIINYRAVSDLTILDLSGKITIGEGSEVLRSAITSLLDKDQKKILLNFDNVAYVDASGMREIQSSFNRVLGIGGQLKFLKLAQRIMDLMLIADFLPESEFFDNEEEALLSFKPTVPIPSYLPSDTYRRRWPPGSKPRRNPYKVRRRLRVFLCHSFSDKQVVRDLCRRLHSINTDPWLDEEQLSPGQDWNHEIMKTVHTSDVVIVCLSRGAIGKAGYVQKEIKYALDVADEQPEGTIFIIPLKLEECDVPERLRRWQWVNLFEPNGFAQLVNSLRLRANTLDTIMPEISPERRA